MCWNRSCSIVAELVCYKNTLPRMRTLYRVHIERATGGGGQIVLWTHVCYCVRMRNGVYAT